MDLSGKVAAITGAASGIGAACAREFARRGARVAVIDRNAAGAQQVASEIAGIAVACDVANEAEVDAMVRNVEAALGPIDIFFNNAGVATGGDPLHTPIDVWADQWQINVMSHVYAIRAVLPGMLKRGSGYILHTASMAGILTTAGNATYAVTKHAVVGLAEWMAIAYHDQGIRTSLLAPLGVNTPMLGPVIGDAARAALGPIKEPEDVGRMEADAIEREQFLITTDPQAEKWMQNKSNDLPRWLHGMRRARRRGRQEGSGQEQRG